MNFAGVDGGTANPTNFYKYNGKELQADHNLNWYDYGARFYDAQIGRWHSVDPKSELRNNITTYNYVQNNPLLRIDPNGETDFTINKETGKVDQKGDKTDAPDRVLKTDKDGNVKKKGEGFLGFLVGKSKRGKPKVEFGVAKGILEDGMDLKEKDYAIDVNGSGEPSLSDVEDFIVNLTEHTNTEMSGGYFTAGSNDDITMVYLDEFSGNDDDYSSTTFEIEKFIGKKPHTHFHSHPIVGKSEKAIRNPSPQDYQTKSGQSTYFKRFIILSNTSYSPKKY